MSETQESGADTPVATAAETLTIVDNRTGQVLRGARSPTARSARSTCARSRPPTDDFGLMTYDPAFTEHRRRAAARSRSSTATRASSSTAAIRSSSWRSRPPSSRSRTCCSTASCPTRTRAARSGRTTITHPHDRARERQERSWTASATTRTRWACCIATVAALSHLLPRGARTSTTTESATSRSYRLIAKMPTLAAFALPARHGHAVRLPGQRPQLRRQLPRT